MRWRPTWFVKDSDLANCTWAVESTLKHWNEEHVNLWLQLMGLRVLYLPRADIEDRSHTAQLCVAETRVIPMQTNANYSYCLKRNKCPGLSWLSKRQQTSAFVAKCDELTAQGLTLGNLWVLSVEGCICLKQQLWQSNELLHHAKLRRDLEHPSAQKSRPGLHN